MSFEQPPERPPERLLRTKCEAKAFRHRMPHFTLIACDNHAIDTIECWLQYAEETGLPDEKIKETRAIIDDMKNWRALNPGLCKNPD